KMKREFARSAQTDLSFAHNQITIWPALGSRCGVPESAVDDANAHLLNLGRERPACLLDPSGRQARVRGSVRGEPERRGCRAVASGHESGEEFAGETVEHRTNRRRETRAVTSGKRFSSRICGLDDEDEMTVDEARRHPMTHIIGPESDDGLHSGPVGPTVDRETDGVTQHRLLIRSEEAMIRQCQRVALDSPTPR